MGSVAIRDADVPRPAANSVKSRNGKCARADRSQGGPRVMRWYVRDSFSPTCTVVSCLAMRLNPDIEPRC